ncbi:44037_t:CDS:2, partial [Gigaspora margarita]
QIHDKRSGERGVIKNKKELEPIGEDLMEIQKKFIEYYKKEKLTPSIIIKSGLFPEERKETKKFKEKFTHKLMKKIHKRIWIPSRIVIAIIRMEVEDTENIEIREKIELEIQNAINKIKTL